MGIEPAEDQCRRLLEQVRIEVLVGVAAAFPIKLAKGRKVAGWPSRSGCRILLGEVVCGQSVAHDPPASAWAGRGLRPGKCGAIDRLTGSGRKGSLLPGSPPSRVGGGGFALVDFCSGDSRILGDRIAPALPAWSLDLPGCRAVIGMHRFGRGTGRFRR